MNSVIDEIYRTRMCEDSDGDLIDVFDRWAPVPYKDGQTLYQIVQETKASKTLETGFAYGLSTMFMCQALVDNGGGSHTAIDPAETTEWKSIGLINVRKAGFQDMVRFYEACSHEILPKLLAEGEEFDFVFIDGFHVFDAVLLDFYYADKLIRPGAHIMLHDIWMPSVRKAVAFVLRNRRYRMETRLMGTCEAFTTWIIRGIKDWLKNPFDVYSSYFLRQRYHQSSFVVLQKISDDDRLWDHYSSF